VGTANFINPRAPLSVADGIGAYLRRQGISSVAEVVGAVKFEG
jgi:hypothetical protein